MTTSRRSNLHDEGTPRNRIQLLHRSEESLFAALIGGPHVPDDHNWKLHKVAPSSWLPCSCLNSQACSITVILDHPRSATMLSYAGSADHARAVAVLAAIQSDAETDSSRTHAAVPVAHGTMPALLQAAQR